MIAVAEQTGQWLAEFTRQSAVAPWMQQLREDAFQRFAELGFPTTHDEDWRFTNVAPIARAKFVHATSVPLITDAPAGPEPNLSETYLGKLASFRENAFVALNTAFLQDVVVIQVPRGAMLEKPIRIDYTGIESAHTAPRTLIVVGADAHCTIVESYSGTGSYFTNAVTEIVAGDRECLVDVALLRAGGLRDVADLQAERGELAVGVDPVSRGDCGPLIVFDQLSHQPVSGCPVIGRRGRQTCFDQHPHGRQARFCGCCCSAVPALDPQRTARVSSGGDWLKHTVLADAVDKLRGQLQLGAHVGGSQQLVGVDHHQLTRRRHRSGRRRG